MDNLKQKKADEAKQHIADAEKRYSFLKSFKNFKFINLTFSFKFKNVII